MYGFQFLLSWLRGMLVYVVCREGETHQEAKIRDQHKTEEENE